MNKPLKSKKDRVRISIKGNYSDPNRKLKAKYYVSTHTAGEIIYLIANRPHETK